VTTDCHWIGTAFVYDGYYFDPEVADGSCICKKGFAGKKCDKCADGFVNFPYCDVQCRNEKPCDPMRTKSCDTVDANGDTVCTCNHPGIGGEFCETCSNPNLLGQNCTLSCNSQTDCSNGFGQTGNCTVISQTVITNPDVNNPENTVLVTGEAVVCKCEEGFFGSDCSQCDDRHFCKSPTINGTGYCGKIDTNPHWRLDRKDEKVPDSGYLINTVL